MLRFQKLCVLSFKSSKQDLKSSQQRSGEDELHSNWTCAVRGRQYFRLGVLGGST